MRKLLITFSLFLLVLLAARGQSNNAFTTVTVVNGKVVFEQFIPIIPSEKSMSTDQRYIQLQNWAKKTFAGNPLLGGIRYDEKARTVTVSNRSEIGRPEKMVMSYRFDVSVNNAGCMLVIRDISYQSAKGNDASFFPKVYTAEQTITDQSINSAGGEAEWRKELRSETLKVFNKLAADFGAVF